MLAANISLDVSRSETSSSWTFSGAGELTEPEKGETGFSWDASGGRSRTQSTSTTGTEIIDNTTSASGGLGVDFPSGLSVGGDYSISVTPEELLTSMGPSAYLSYTHKFLPPQVVKKGVDTESDEAEGYAQRLGFKLGVASQRYDQQFEQSASPRRGAGSARPTTGHNTIDQRALELSLKYKPLEWLRFKIKSVRYSYSRDVNEFMSYLDSQDKRTTTSGFNSALSGFSSSEYGGEIDFYFLDNWEVDLASKTSINASDNSLTKTYKVEVYLDFLKAWRIGLGTTRYVYDTSTSTNNSLSLAYDL